MSDLHNESQLQYIAMISCSTTVTMDVRSMSFRFPGPGCRVAGASAGTSRFDSGVVLIAKQQEWLINPFLRSADDSMRPQQFQVSLVHEKG